MSEIDRLRKRATDAFAAGVAAAEPARAVNAALDRHPITPPGGRIILIAMGKAARAMASAAMARLDADEVLVITNDENARPLDGARVLPAGHPVPNENGLIAGQQVLSLLADAGPDDLIVALISGGASALVPAPAPGLTLADKIAVNEMLLASGFEIGEMNLVRQALSELKGGGFLQKSAPAAVVSFILSDVLGDDLRVVASGPTVGPVGPPDAARGLLKERGLWQTLSPQVQKALTDATPRDTVATKSHLIGSNTQSLEAMARAAGAKISPEPLVGDVREAALRVVDEAKTLAPGGALAFGGETTVQLTGTGRGGRNQELALRVAAESQGLTGDWVFLSGGTDGRDGPTDAAGGLVDNDTLQRLADAGLSLDQLLANNDSYKALDGAGDLLMTGATGTNVADLQLFIRMA